MKRSFLVAASCLLLLATANAAFSTEETVAKRATPYSGHKVVRAVLNDEAQRLLVELLDADVWTAQSQLIVGSSNTFALSPDAYLAFVNAGITHEVLIDDLEANILAKESQKALVHGRRSLEGTPPLSDEWFATWHSYSEIQEKLHALAQAFPNVTEFFPNLGTSYEGRAISGIRVGTGKNKVVFLSGTHAREWIAEAVTLWFIGASLQEFKQGTNPFPDASVYIVPCYNPDGYEYSRTSYRYWRKNRHKNSDGTFGVDQNRNWDVDWCIHGSSKSPSSDIYCGTAPLSESETKAMANWVTSLQPVSLIDFHSHANMLLRPYGYKSAIAPDEARIKAVNNAMKTAIAAVHGTSYVCQRSVELYPSSGGADDWAYEKSGSSIKMVNTIELAGTDFVVPVTDITKQGEEMYPALKIWVNAEL